MKKLKQNWIKILGIIGVLGLSIFIIRLISLEDIRRWVQESGRFGPLIYILLFSILPIFFFPVPALALGGGVLFGLVEGTIYTVIGATINSGIMFYMSRYLGRNFFRDFIRKKMKPSIQEKFLTKDQRILTGMFFFFRLVPLISYEVINYLSGLTEIKFLPYILSSILGIIPGTLVYLNVGDKALDLGSSDFWLAIFLLLLLTLVSFIALRIYMKWDSNGHDNHTDL